MDDLASRIAQQNQEKSVENSQKLMQDNTQRSFGGMQLHDREANLRAQEGSLQNELDHAKQQQPYHAPPQQHYQLPPHFQQPPPQHYQPPPQFQHPPQQHFQQPPPQQYPQQPPPQPQFQPPQFQPPAQQQQAPLTEEMLRSQERELDRQLREERSRVATRPPASSRGGVAPYPQPGKENKQRASIPLMPPGSAAPSTAVPPSTSRPEPLRRPVHFSHTMVKSGAETQMNEFLKPAGGIRDQMRKAGIEPKDHARENRRHLQGIASKKAYEKEQKELTDIEKRHREQHLRERAAHQAEQYVMPEGPQAGRRSVRQPQVPSLPPRDPAAGRHEPGAVPDYLKRRKAEWAAEADVEAQRAAMAAQCPPGLRLVGEEEKARILGTLEGEKEKAEAALLELPFVIKTHATQKRKDQLEARLLEIDGAVAAYSKEKVLVPMDS